MCLSLWINKNDKDQFHNSRLTLNEDSIIFNISINISKLESLERDKDWALMCCIYHK